jgi:WD40 repeat protein
MEASPPAPEQELKRPDRPDVFVCYAREDAPFVWNRLVGALEARGKAIWIDRVDIPPAADWRDRIEKGIDAARAFVFVLSPASIASYECGQELRQAINGGKRLIPVVVHDVEPDDVSIELKRPNWIELRDDDRFDEHLGLLIAALDTDLQWVDQHARLTVRAKEWDRGGHDASRLLRGRELRDARRWLSEQPLHAEPATAQQRAYIVASRNAVIRRRIILGVAVLAAAAIAGTFGVLAIIRARERSVALAERRLADSRQVAFEAQALDRRNPDLSMLLAIKAYRIAPTLQARSSLLSEQPQLYAGALPAQPPGIESIAFSPDGRALATATASHVRLWDPARHALVASIGQQYLTPNGVSYSPDGRLLAVPTFNALTLWDASPPYRKIGSLPGLKLGFGTAAFSPDGRMIATPDMGGTVHLFALPSRRLLRVLKLFSRTTDRLEFDPVDPSVLAAVGDHQTVKLVNVRTGARLESLPGNSDPIYSTAIAFSPDGRSIATAATSHRVRIFSTRGSRLLATLSGNTNVVDGIAFSPDGRTVATASGRDATLWDPTNGAPLTTLPPLATGVDHVQFSPDGSLLAVSSIEDGTVSLWRMRGSIFFDRFNRYRVAFNHRGDELAAVDGGGALELRDTRSRRLRRLLRPDPREPGVGSTTRDVAFSPDDRMVATAGKNAVWVWDVRTGAVVARVGVPRVDFVSSLAFSPDGHTISVASGTGPPIFLIDLASRRITGRLELPAGGYLGGYSRLLYTAGGRFLIAEGAKVVMWDLHTKRVVRTLNTSPGAIALSPDRHTLAAGYGNGSIVLWDLRTGHRAASQLNSFGGHLGPVQDSAFSADGRTLASAGQDATVKLWDVAGSGKLITTLSGHSDPVNSVAFSPDGTLASGGQDGALIFWDRDPQREIRLICGTLRTNLSRDNWARYVPDVPYRPVC